MLIQLVKSLRRQRSRPSEPAQGAADDIRLHIGGEQRHPDWKVFDIRAASHVDYVGSCSDLSMFAAGSVAEIYASHVLEHLGYIDELGTALQEWHRVIVPGGTWHNVVNTGDAPLKLYSLYAPPEHPDRTVHKTKADADAAEADDH